MIQKIEKYEDEYRWLSNFVDCPITISGEFFGVQVDPPEKYASVEHAYQAFKSKDPEVRKKFQYGVKVIKGKTPKGELVVGPLKANEAKKAGRNIQCRGDWDQIKVEVMRALKRQKYSKQPFRRLLLATGDAEIIHGVWWNDTFWGVRYGIGKNIDGRLTMDIRKELQDALIAAGKPAGLQDPAESPDEDWLNHV